MADPQLNLERLETMAEYRRNGATLEEIGGLYGLSRERVRQLLNKAAQHGFLDDPQKYLCTPARPQLLEDVVELQHLPGRAVAELLGITLSCVRNRRYRATKAGLLVAKSNLSKEEKIARLFERNTKEVDGHLLWTGAVSNGRPLLQMWRSVRSEGSVTLSARKYAWESLTQQPVPGNLINTCGEARCILPAHQKHYIPIQNRRRPA